MNKLEAQSILDQQLSIFAHRPYSELAALVDVPKNISVQSPSGVEYQIELNVFYDSGKGGDLRIFGSIDDGGLRAIVPLTKTLIMKPDGEWG